MTSALFVVSAAYLDAIADVLAEPRSLDEVDEASSDVVVDRNLYTGQNPFSSERLSERIVADVAP